MKSKLKLVGLIAFFIFVTDHFTKWLIVEYLPLGHSFSVIPNFFDITHGRNTGAAFGFLSDWDSPLKNWFFYVVGALAMVFLYFYLKGVKQKDRLSQLALGLILGGALGNVTDRVLRNSVVDFLSVHFYDKILDFTVFDIHFVIPMYWPAFNIADSAISIAVTLLIIQNFREPQTN